MIGLVLGPIVRCLGSVLGDWSGFYRLVSLIHKVIKSSSKLITNLIGVRLWYLNLSTFN